MNWYIQVLKRYAVFSGRSGRKECWYFVLFNLIATFILVFTDSITGTLDAAMGYGLLSGIYSLAVLLPAIGVTIRCLHNIGRSGWWILIGFIPLYRVNYFIDLFRQGQPAGRKSVRAFAKGDLASILLRRNIYYMVLT